MPLAGTDAAEVDRSSLYLPGWGPRVWRLSAQDRNGRMAPVPGVFRLLVISSCARPSILESYAGGAGLRNPRPAHRAKAMSPRHRLSIEPAGLSALAPLGGAALSLVCTS